MKVLIAEDDSISRTVLESLLMKWGYEVVVARDGTQAWDLLQKKDAPRLVVLDWMMPGIDGVEICRRLRAAGKGSYSYIVLLTMKGDPESIVEGLDAGADDYMVKPYNMEELRSRLRAGKRILELQENLVSARKEQRRSLFLV
jgi:two-component system, cell cycle response regulator